MPMGFLADVNGDQDTFTRGAPEKAVYTFDSGTSLSLDDLVHHLICFGTTGSGKTASVALPLAGNLIRLGLGGLICDIKGSMGDDIRRIAAAHAREADIVEYGCGQSAKKVNLLKYMTRDGRRRFFESLATENFGQENLQWAVKGAHQAADCAELLWRLAPVVQGLDPTIGLVAEMIECFEETAKLWDFYKKNVLDKGDGEQARFLSGIQNNKFHIFHFGDKEKTGSSGSSSKAGWEEQVTWNLQGIRMGLKSFLEAPGVPESFSVQGAPGLDIASDVMAGRLILVRFGLDTGPVGAKLTRLIVSDVYRSLLGTSLKKRGRPFFVLMDEFHELADLSGERFSDKNFVALARSFGGIFIGLTQSMASIRCDGGWTADAVESFVSNCNNVVSFYSSDLVTQDLAMRHDPAVVLGDLEPCHAFVVRYDKATRRHAHGVETMNNEYLAMRNLLEGAAPRRAPSDEPSEMAAAGSLQQEAAQKSVYDIVNELPKPEKPEKREKPAGFQPRRGFFADASERTEKPRFGSTRPEKEDEMKREKSNELPEYAREIVEKYPSLFADEVQVFDVPRGWRDAFVRILGLYDELGFSGKIDSVCMVDGRLEAIDSGVRRSNPILRKLLGSLSGLCMICGEACGGGEKAGGRGAGRGDAFDDDFDDVIGPARPDVPICDGCLRRHGIVRSRQDEVGKAS